MPDSMKISALIKRLSPRRIEGSQDTEISGLFYDSRKVVEQGAFFALRGVAADGHSFIDQALRAGASAVFTEEHVSLPEGVTGVLVDDTRLALALAAASFYEEPAADIPVVGVTGTNGKTTVTYLVESILEVAGKRPAVLGTVNYRFGEHCLPAAHTTPESADLLRILADFRKEGCDALAMEVSSHALDQHRVAGVHFDVGVFTNLTREHLDYHGKMEAYFASKARLFDQVASGGGRVVLNIDDPYGVRLADRFPSALTCGVSDRAQVRPREVRLSLGGIEALVDTPRGAFALRSALLGRFNLQNLLCAAAAALALEIPLEAVAEGLEKARAVPGRMESIDNRLGAQILVDYAHTGDALEKALSTMKDLSPRRIVVVFGCGGDRDRSKRPLMGEIGARLADLSVLTSDNPRSEDPMSILAEVREGARRVIPEEWSPEEARKAEGRGFVSICDRAEAIEFAVSLLGPGDLLLVAGKGHEDYQIVGRQRLHFDDREELRRALARLETSA